MVNETEADLAELRMQLQEIEERFLREMRARGFDPSQAETLALPSTLARLFIEREEMREKVAELQAKSGENK